MIIWIIGYIFTLGLTADEDPGFWTLLLLVVIWPFVLGMAAKDLLRENKSPDKSLNSDPQ